MPKYDDPERLIPLAEWLSHNSIPPLAYVDALLRGEAPPAIRAVGSLYIARGDATLYRDRLRAEAYVRSAEILAQEPGAACDA